MRNVKWLRVSLVGFCCLLVGLGGFALWLNGGQKEAIGEPVVANVTIPGNPFKLPAEIQSVLPTGYRWTLDDLSSISPIDSTSQVDPRALFVIAPWMKSVDIKAQLDWAEKMGKQEIYFLIYEKPDPDSVIPYLIQRS